MKDYGRAIKSVCGTGCESSHLMEQEKDLSGQENLLGLSLEELAQDYGQDAVEAIHGKKDSGE